MFGSRTQELLGLHKFDAIWSSLNNLLELEMQILFFKKMVDNFEIERKIR